MQGFEFLYLAMFILGFAGSGALVWWTRRKLVDQPLEADVSRPTRLGPSERPSVSSTSRSRPTPMELPSVAPEQAAEIPAVAQLLFAPKGNGDRECPTCKRMFDETTILCPFDATPLRVFRARKRTTRPVITGARRPTCHSCGRRFESAASHCYHDGRRLSADSPAEVPIVRLCRSCGFETLDSHDICSCDDPEMMEIDPARSDIMLPTIPMMQCRSCNHLAPGGETRCPDDGSLLYPVMNVSMNALPPTGIGPRRKICEKCGRKFSSAARYCAYDGSKLTHLN